MRTHRHQQQQRLEAVRKLAPFASCTMKELGVIDSLGAAVTVPAGVDLLQQGATGRECFLVEAGSVRISRSADEFFVVGAGDWVGEMALLQGLPRNATATTLTTTTVWVFDPSEFSILLSRVPSVDRQVRDIADTRRSAHESERATA